MPTWWRSIQQPVLFLAASERQLRSTRRVEQQMNANAKNASVPIPSVGGAGQSRATALPGVEREPAEAHTPDGCDEVAQALKGGNSAENIDSLDCCADRESERSIDEVVGFSVVAPRGTPWLHFLDSPIAILTPFYFTVR